MWKYWFIGGLCSLLSLGMNAPIHAHTPSGSQFQVNSYTTDDQDDPVVATDADGNFVVIWESDVSDGTDSSDDSVQGQRYDSTGTPLGSQFQVNSYTTNDQDDAAVAADPAGNFVVVWESDGSSSSDADKDSIQGQRYDSAGSPLGGQFQINSYTTDDQTDPAVATDAAGNFVVIWESVGSSGSDTDGYSIQGQRYDSTGSPLGGEFQVNAYTTNNQGYPSVATDAAGNFVVVWESDGSSGSDTDGYSVQGQRYDSTGSPLGGQFQVNSYTTDDQDYPSVASDADGNFVVVWESNGSSGSDTSDDSIQGQRFDSTGSPVGSQFQVNSHTPADQDLPVVASDAYGNFVVVWESDSSSGSDTDDDSIQARRYNSAGSPIGGQFQVNSYTTDDQDYPAVAVGPHHTFVVVWESDGSSGSDTDDDSIQAQRYGKSSPFSLKLKQFRIE